MLWRMKVIWIYVLYATAASVDCVGQGKSSLVPDHFPRFDASSEFLDAAINSLNALNSLVTKENYRIKVTSFNNPTSTDMGFSLETEIQSALKPLLAKARNTNGERFNEVVSSIITSQGKMPATRAVNISWNPVFTTIVSLVGSMVVQEKRITRADLDSFIFTTSRYFIQYQRLYAANQQFDQNLDKLTVRLKEVQFDIREYMLDLVSILHRPLQRNHFKGLNIEELYLKFLDQQKLKLPTPSDSLVTSKFPSDGIKTAKEIAYSLQKLFNEYQKVYEENYQQIRGVLTDSKQLGRQVNLRQVEASLKELEELYIESRTSDVLGLRLTTLMERLRVLVETEQMTAVVRS